MKYPDHDQPRVYSLIERAQAVASLGWAEAPDDQRRLRHAQRLVNMTADPGCSAMARGPHRHQMHTCDAPNLGEALLRRHKPAVASLTDDRGHSDVLVEAAAVVKAFGTIDDAGKGRMVMDAVRLLGLSRRGWAFWEGSGAHDRPEVLVQDLNVTNRLARWFGLYACSVEIGVAEEGFYLSVREYPEGALRGPAIELHLEYFDTMGHALAIGLIVYAYARRVGLTKAWIRDL